MAVEWERIIPPYHDLYGERERRIETGGKECAESKYNMDEVRGEREEDMKLKVTSRVLYGNEKGFVGRAEKRKMLKERTV